MGMAEKGNPCGEAIRFEADDFLSRDVICAVRVRQCRMPRARAMIAVVYRVGSLSGQPSV